MTSSASTTRHLPLSELLVNIGACIARAGGRALLVGGAVRDMLLGMEPKDLDIEVFGLSETQLTEALETLGQVLPMGRAFAVWQVRGLGVDFTLPRAATFAEAARHRDLTINSMGLDLHNAALVDPLGGQADLQRGVLAACDPRYFGDDALRVLRVAQLMARFEMRPDAALSRLCAHLDVSRIAPERMYGEFCKLLLKARKPSLGLDWLAQTGQLKAFETLDAMRGVAQDPKWHPEGDVWVHTCMVVDCAAALRDGGEDDLVLMWSALLHDVGKPQTTFVEDGRIRSPNHDVAGQAPAEALLLAFKAPHALVTRVGTLVRHHLAPAMLQHGKASDRAYRRLYRAMGQKHVDLKLLARLSRADHLGRTTLDAIAGQDAATDAFEARIKALNLVANKPLDVVLGRDLIAAGLTPGPLFRAVLDACRVMQDATGSTDAAQILSDVLKALPAIT